MRKSKKPESRRAHAERRMLVRICLGEGEVESARVVMASTAKLVPPAKSEMSVNTEVYQVISPD